jgi:DNA-binding XRE family transcriptional regulator
VNLKKYFWSLSPKALKEVKAILKNPNHPRFLDRAFTLLSRCDKPKEVFSVIEKRQFVAAWPRVRKYWVKMGQAPEFRSWWETIYEQLSKGESMKAPGGYPSNIVLKIGKIIHARRLKKGISQMDFARQVGMRQPDISAIEAGRKNVTLETLIRLCKMLGIKNIPLS